MAAFINTNFIPVRLHVKNHGAEMKRFAVDWTPTVLLVDADGKELYRIEGFLPQFEVQKPLTRHSFNHPTAVAVPPDRVRAGERLACHAI